tara:strand:- start:21840 stop:22277 length:438 start_codon:yes stop_codon:yes gene_type:complete
LNIDSATTWALVPTAPLLALKLLTGIASPTRLAGFVIKTEVRTFWCRSLRTFTAITGKALPTRIALRIHSTSSWTIRGIGDFALPSLTGEVVATRFTLIVAQAKAGTLASTRHTLTIRASELAATRATIGIGLATVRTGWCCVPW